MRVLHADKAGTGFRLLFVGLRHSAFYKGIDFLGHFYTRLFFDKEMHTYGNEEQNDEKRHEEIQHYNTCYYDTPKARGGPTDDKAAISKVHDLTKVKTTPIQGVGTSRGFYQADYVCNIRNQKE